ncbi:MAG: DNA polymerase III subunit psi [Legionella sp.]|jgi:DNA polymerase III psi subunit
MYSESTLYYLNQIGIRPWIRKNVHQTQLLVLVPSQQSQKAQKLMQNMLEFLGLPKNEIMLLSATDTQKLELDSLKVVWSLGAEVVEGLKNYPIVLSCDPEFLLDNPAQKKGVLGELLQVKQLLC